MRKGNFQKTINKFLFATYSFCLLPMAQRSVSKNMQKASFTFECSFLGSGQLYLEFDNVMSYLTEGSQLFPRNCL